MALSASRDATRCGALAAVLGDALVSLSCLMAMSCTERCLRTAATPEPTGALLGDKQAVTIAQVPSVWARID